MSVRVPSLPTTLRADALAAVTVTLVGIPQCLAYALMAGLPPAYGLSTAAVAGLVSAIAGRSAQVVSGPTNTTGLLILVALTPMLDESGLLAESALPALATLTLMAGLVRLLAAYLGGASLIDFLPESVLVGFTAGAGVLIATMQLDEALGLVSVGGGSLEGELRAVTTHLAGSGWPAVAMTVGTVVAIALGKRLAPRWPLTLAVVLAGGIAAVAFGLDQSTGLPLVGDRAYIPSGWPPGALPSLDPSLIRSFLAPAAALALLGTLELAVTARNGGARPDMRREIAGQGVANVAAAFASGFPASASLTRSALVVMAGGRSRVALVLAAVFTLPVLWLGGPLVAVIPQSSLAGVLMWTAYRMTASQPIRRMWVASAATRLIMTVTFLATLFLPLETAILSGAILGALIHLARTNRPRIQLLAPRGARLVPVDSGAGLDVVVVEVSGDMHYAATASFVRDTRARLPHGTRHVVLELSHARAMRFAALRALEEVADHVRAWGGTLHLAGIGPEFAVIVRRTASRLTYTRYDPEPLVSVWTCLRAIEDSEGDSDGNGNGYGGGNGDGGGSEDGDGDRDAASGRATTPGARSAAAPTPAAATAAPTPAGATDEPPHIVADLAPDTSDAGSGAADATDATEPTDPPDTDRGAR